MRKISVITVQMHATMNENNLTVAKKTKFKTCSHPECPNCDRCKGGYCNRMNWLYYNRDIPLKRKHTHNYENKII